MLPRGIGNQIAAPAVGEFVRNDIDILAVLIATSISAEKRLEYAQEYLGDDTWSCKGEDGIFHSSVRETRRQNQNVVLAPDIGVDNFLVFTQHEKVRLKLLASHTSMVLMKFSVSASSSHLHSSSLSGLVVTTLRGPIGASETSLFRVSGIKKGAKAFLPARNSKKIAGDWDRLVESVELIPRLRGRR